MRLIIRPIADNKVSLHIIWCLIANIMHYMTYNSTMRPGIKTKFKYRMYF